MRRMNYLNWIATIATVLALAPAGNAQTFNNSYSRMLDMTRTWNTNLWTAQKGVQQVLDNGQKVVAAQNGTPSSYPAQQPLGGQFPLEATDFQTLPVRVLPDQLAASGVNLHQKLAMRTLYFQFLTEYERQYRRNNIAVAATYAVVVSLRVDRGRQLSVEECNQLIFYFNDRLATVPQFASMSQQQKQILYESLILTAATAGVLFEQGSQQGQIAMQSQGRELAQSVLRQWAGM